MPPSDKNKTNSEASEDSQREEDCSKPVTMDTTAPSDPATSSAPDLTLPDHGTIANIPLFTANINIPTLKCSINDQMKTFDPGEVSSNTERLNNNNNQSGSSLVFPVKCSNSIINNNKNPKNNYKAGSKINKLADMLAKRSQNIVEVTSDIKNNDFTVLKTNEVEPVEVKTEDDEVVNDPDKTVNDKPVDLVKKSRRKSVPNQSCTLPEPSSLQLQSNNSKSCSDISELFTDKNKKEIALEVPLLENKPQTDESTKNKKVIRKNLKNVELSLILPEKKRRSSPRCKKITSENNPVPKLVNNNKKESPKPALRKSKRLVETSTQTADIEFISLVVTETTENGGKPTHACFYCSETFSSGPDCKSHEKTHAVKKKSKQLIKCQFCSKKVPSLIEIKSHCVKSHPNKYFVCVKCDERYPEKEGLNSHVKEFHPTEEEKTQKSGDLKIDVTFDSGKKSSTSPRILLPKSSPRESKTEEQLLEAEMLFYSHLSGNIQENLANHLDGKIDKNGNPVRTDQISDSADSGSLLSVAVPNPGVPVIQISRAPSPYQTRSKTPNPLPPTAKKFKKLPNWQQKFWEKYNFPTNYRFEHRFWDKNYLNTEKSPFYLKDLSCLDIKTQLTMRENIKKLDVIKASEETAKNQDRLSFPDYLSLIPKTNTDPEEKSDPVKIPEYGRGKRIKDLTNKKSFKSPPAGELPKNKKSNAELRKQPEKTRIADGKMMTRRQSSVDLGKEVKAEENVRRRKGSLDMSTGQKMVLRRQTSLDNLQGSSKTDEDNIVDNDLEVVGSDSEESSSTLPAGTAEISGEWVRPRSYLCGTCCLRFTNLWELEDHKWTSHPNVWCTHYEFEDDKIDKLFTKNEDDDTSSPDNASSAFTKHKLTDLYKRYLLPHGSLKTAKLIPNTNFPEQCTKCKKNCTNSSELHKHMLDCGGDTNWFLTMYSSPTTMKRKWRPFGSRRRKQIGRRMVKRNIPSTPTMRPYQYQHRIRTKPGDVESIQKMLANLPEKRARRAINFDEIKTRSQATIHSNRLLRKRFKVSFGSNFMRLKNFKTAQQRLKPIKKESSSKSNTDTSSESTPIGSPKRKIRTKEATQPPKSETVTAETVETVVKDEKIKSPKKKPAGNAKNKKLNPKKKPPSKASPKGVPKNGTPETATAAAAAVAVPAPAPTPDKKKPAKKKPAAAKTQPKIKKEIVAEETKTQITAEKPTNVKKQSILRLRQNDKDKTELIKKIKKKLNNSKRILESKLKSERRRSERIKTLQESPEMPNGELEIKIEAPEGVNGTPEIVVPEEPVKKSPKRKVDLSEMPILDKEEPLKGRTSRKNEPEIPVLMPFENGTDEGKDSLRFKIVSKKRKTPEEKVTPLKIVKETEESKKRKTETKNSKVKKHFLGINPNEIDKGGEKEKDESESDSEPLISLVGSKKIEEPDKKTEEPEVKITEEEVTLKEAEQPEIVNKIVTAPEVENKEVEAPIISLEVTEKPEVVPKPKKSTAKVTKKVKAVEKPKVKPKPKKVKAKAVENPEVVPEQIEHLEVTPEVEVKPKKVKAKAIAKLEDIEKTATVVVPKPKKSKSKVVGELLPEIVPEVLPVMDPKPKKSKSKAVEEQIPEMLPEVLPILSPKSKKIKSNAVEEPIPEILPEAVSVVDVKPKRGKSKPVEELIPEILPEAVPVMDPKPKKGKSKAGEELIPEISPEVAPVMDTKPKKGKSKALEELIPEILSEVLPAADPKPKKLKVKAVEEPELIPAIVPEMDEKLKKVKSKPIEEPEITAAVIEAPVVDPKQKKLKSKAIKIAEIAPEIPKVGAKPKKTKSKAFKVTDIIPETVENSEVTPEMSPKLKKSKSKAVKAAEIIPEIVENPEITPELDAKPKKIKSKDIKMPDAVLETVENVVAAPESDPISIKIKPKLTEVPEINFETLERLEMTPKPKKLKSRQPKKPVKRLRMKVTLKEPTLKIPDKLPAIPSENKWTIKPVAEIPESPSTAPERRSRRISKETKTSNEFVIDDPFLLVDELWSELDSDSDSSKKKSKKYKKKSPRKKTKTEVDLEKILRNFGEKKEDHQKIIQRVRKIPTNQEIRERLEQPQKSNPKSFKRLSLRLFRFNKKPKNLGYQGIKLSKAIKDITDEKKETLPGISYLASEITENPVQIIQCGRQKSKRKNLKKLIKPVTEKIQLKVSVPLESINNLAVLNNNHLTEVVMEELPPPIPEEPPQPPPPPPPPPAPEIVEPAPAETEVLPKPRRSEVIDKIFYCEICKTYYYSSSQLKNHKMSNRHKQKELELTAVEEPQPSAPEPIPEPIPVEPVPEVLNGVVEPSQPEIVPEIDKINEDTSEMPILEGPFIENPFVRLGMERIEPAPKPPPPPPPPPSNPFGFSEDCLKDIQKAIGCTDEEMLILTLLGENSIEIENDILDLDSCQPVKSGGNKSDSVKSDDGQKENAEKSNGIFKIDLKKRMTSALACLVNKAVFNLLQKSGSASKAGVNPEALSFLNKLSSVSHKKNILQLNELLKKQSFGESSVGSLLKDDEKPNQRIPYKYQCTICGSRFEKASTRECHIIRTHRAKSKKLSSEESQISQTPYEEDQSDWNDTWSYDGNDDVLASQTSQFWCSDCGINFHSPQEVLEHQKLEHQTIKEPEPVVETSGPLQSSTIGSSDEIVEGKKPPPKRRSKHFSTAELDQQRILANNELRKLDRKFSNKNKPNKAKWGMDALKFTVEKENKVENKVEELKASSVPEEVSSEEPAKASPVVDKTIDIVPKLNLSRTNNIPEFKVIQKNTLENRFQKIIDNKIKRKSTKNDLESEEPEVPEVPEVVNKKPERKRRASNKNGKKNEERKVYDVYDFNESESETEPIVLSHVKKTPAKKGKEGSEPSKNKADSTTKDLAPDDYDSEDSLPLAVVKKGKEEEEEDEEGQKSEGILEQVEYLIEQLEGEDDKEKKETESFRISLENKFLQLDNIPLKKKDGEKVSDEEEEEEDSLPLKMVKEKAKESPPELLSSAVKSPEFKASEESSLPPLLSNEFDNLNGNVIYRRNSVSDFESEMSNDGAGLMDDSEQSLIQEVMEKEDVVIVCSKEEKANGKRKRNSVDSSQKKKKIIPLLSATIEEDNFRKSESPKLNKEVIVKKIWSRKKPEEGKDPNEEIDKEMIMKKIWSRKKTEDGEKKPETAENVKINQTEISDEVVIKCGPKTKTRRKSKTSNESSKETIMRRIWSGKCTFQTKAALKTYETDIPQTETEEVVDSTQTAKRKRQPSISASKRAKTDDEISEDEDDLDSLLEEIERENVEKAIRLEFLQLRRSDKNPEISKEITEVGLFTETLPEVKEIPDKKRRKVRKNPTKRIIRRKVTKKPPATTKKPLPTVETETEAEDAILTSDAILNDAASDASEASLLERSNELDLESKIKSHKHKKHRHKHHHHKHKHKKSKHHGDNKHKNKHKLENGESLSLWEKICQDLPEDLKDPEPTGKLVDDLLSNPPLTEDDDNKTSDIWQGNESREENVYDFVDEDSEFSLNKKKNFKK